jgi:hypothetical protein
VCLLCNFGPVCRSHNFCVGWLHVNVSVCEGMFIARTEQLSTIQLEYPKQNYSDVKNYLGSECVSEGVL